jgi:predicted secreted protein
MESAVPHSQFLNALFPNVLRFLAPALLLLVFQAPIAQAGDTARIQLLGFSKDGSRFAFEQYGVQDGSGFPYSEIFILDVTKDSWVKPSPFRRQDEVDDSQGYDEEALLAAARAENRAVAQPHLRTSGIAGKGLTVGHNPHSELNSDPHRMVVNPLDMVPPADDPLELQLSEYPMTSGDCASFGAETKGFKLTLTYHGKTRVLNNDTKVPSSRNCPLRYRIERIVTHFPNEAPPVFAVLIQMDSHGFEGPDRRYLAITGQL